MPQGTTAYLVIRREDGFGEVHPLTPGPRFTLGRSPNNRIVLKSDSCSREHAEVYESNGKWYLRDLGSLNGSKINGQTVTSDVPLKPLDEIYLGGTTFLFVHDLSQLPELPAQPAPGEVDLAIRKRLGQTKYLTKPQPPAETPSRTTRAFGKISHPHERDIAFLYRLALSMGTATTPQELVEVVLNGLLEAIPAEVGALLAIKGNNDLELLAYRHRNPETRTYHKVSQFVSREVLQSREAVLAENVAADAHFKNRESLSELHVTSLICAPVLFGETLLGLIHLYSTDQTRRLCLDDLELALAIARQLGVATHQLQRQQTLSNQNLSLKAQLRQESELVGQSSAMRLIESQIQRVAETNATVLIRGESGVGKELVARAIHANSPRRDGPLICLNCAALTDSLLESELFGHEKGAFTGATERYLGKFESADHGTIFLDEIGEMNLNTQAKLLRVLEGHAFERVGGNTPIRVNVRVVAATNAPLEDQVRAGTFRKDLFYRLQVVEIRVPPLRERVEDVLPLAEHFLARFVRETGRKIRGFTSEAKDRLRSYSWPGNVRELRNVIERAVALSVGPFLDASDIWLSGLDLSRPSEPRPYAPLSLEEMEREHIAATLAHTQWNKSQAAAILGIERSTLDRKIRSYKIEKE